MFSRRPRSLAVGPFRESLSRDDAPEEIDIEVGPRDCQKYLDFDRIRFSGLELRISDWAKIHICIASVSS